MRFHSSSPANSFGRVYRSVFLIVMMLNVDMDLASSLAPEIYGLLLHDMELTGFSFDEILLQSYFNHFPELFQVCGSSIHVPFFLFKEHALLLKSLARSLNYSIPSTILHLFHLELEPVESSRFPSSSLILPVLETYRELSFLPIANIYQVFLEKLVLLYHLAIQPHEIVAAAILDQSEWMECVMVPMTWSQAKSVLSQTSVAFYNVKRVDYELIRRIHQRTSLGLSLNFGI